MGNCDKVRGNARHEQVKHLRWRLPPAGRRERRVGVQQPLRLLGGQIAVLLFQQITGEVFEGGGGHFDPRRRGGGGDVEQVGSADAFALPTAAQRGGGGGRSGLLHSLFVCDNLQCVKAKLRALLIRRLRAAVPSSSSLAGGEAGQPVARLGGRKFQLRCVKESLVGLI